MASGETTSREITNKLWALSHVLRDDGIVFHKYISELTYLLFLKISDELGMTSSLADGCTWNELVKHSGAGMVGYYRKMLTQLGEDSLSPVVRKIFGFPTTVFSHDENLAKVVAEIAMIDWSAAKGDGFGTIYESLLERNATESRSGAGQYFTPRPLVDCMVNILRPRLGEVIQDPAAGTGGFLISGNEYLRRSYSAAEIKKKPVRFEGVEIERDTYRLCLMNLVLHGIDGQMIHGDALTEDASALTPPDVIFANPPFGSGAGSARPRRADLPHQTSNKQLMFVQHISHANLDDLASFRCVIQLNHSVAPAAPKGAPPNRKGIQLTNELEKYISALMCSSTSWSYDEKNEIYIFDFLVTPECREAFAHFFKSAINLYRALHKLSLLNDLAIPRAARDRLKKEIETRRFASRLPEPQDEDKVFRFEQVRFRRGHTESVTQLLDYVSLSDGEHQFAQILGVFSMIREANALFILDEPESHFNPQWRIQFTKTLLALPIEGREAQEVLLTTHAPFVPCDLHRDQVFIFAKNPDGQLTIDSPEVETFGATFDRILETCFGIRPPISQVARDEINALLKSGSAAEIKMAMERLGPSVEKSFLADRVRQLSKS